MAKYTQALSTNTTVTLGCVHKNRNYPTCELLFFGHGTWGSGTLSLFWSPDGGTTKIAITDLANVAVTATANFGVRASFVTGHNNTDCIMLYATLAGSSGASLTVGFYDNN